MPSTDRNLCCITPPAITDTEIVRRRATLDQAGHSGEMEGQHIAAEARADGEGYATGRIDVDELIARGRAQ